MDKIEIYKCIASKSPSNFKVNELYILNVRGKTFHSELYYNYFSSIDNASFEDNYYTTVNGNYTFEKIAEIEIGSENITIASDRQKVKVESIPLDMPIRVGDIVRIADIEQCYLNTTNLFENYDIPVKYSVRYQYATLPYLNKEYSVEFIVKNVRTHGQTDTIYLIADEDDKIFAVGEKGLEKVKSRIEYKKPTV